MAFGVLTTNSVEEALGARGEGSGNKGHEAAVAAIEMAEVVAQLTRQRRQDLAMAGAEGPRHRAREAALQILYQWEIGGATSTAAETFFALQWPNATAADDLREFATALAADTTERLDEIDPLIADTAERWRPERMAIPRPADSAHGDLRDAAATPRRRRSSSSTRHSSSRARSRPRNR
jgi:hypothetical protein